MRTGVTRVRLGADDLRISLILTLLVIGIAFIVAYLFLLLGMPGDDFLIAYADDTESDLGLCSRGYTDHCADSKFLHDLYGKLLIWNAVCNPPLNQTQDFCLNPDNMTNYNKNNTQSCDLAQQECRDIIAPQIQGPKH